MYVEFFGRRHISRLGPNNKRRRGGCTCVDADNQLKSSITDAIVSGTNTSKSVFGFIESYIG